MSSDKLSNIIFNCFNLINFNLNFRPVTSKKLILISSFQNYVNCNEITKFNFQCSIKGKLFIYLRYQNTSEAIFVIDFVFM